MTLGQTRAIEVHAQQSFGVAAVFVLAYAATRVVSTENSRAIGMAALNVVMLV